VKVLLSWLRQYAPFPSPLDSDAVEVLDHAFGMIGLPVEDVVRFGTPIAGVITAKVLSLAKHPQADRIQLVEVDTGNGEPLQICCGAFNMAVGDTVPLASLGTTMPGGMLIERRKLRGEWSNGMLCSSKELGLDEEHGGIKILSSDLPLGVDVFDALGIEADVLFDIDVTRNRPDCFGHSGVARELAAFMGLAFTDLDPQIAVAGPSDGVTVRIDSPELCGRFTARRITGARVVPSPQWIADRLHRAGMRPINNLVDASNLVMLEMNRPTHAYDAAKVPGRGFVVRGAHDGETMVTLDGNTRVLQPNDSVICDAHGVAIGIGGIMGGASSEVDDTTKELLFEQAWFPPEAIAQTARRLGLRTEAGYRFERGCDPFDDDLGARRFVELIRFSCPDAQLHDVVAATGDLPTFGVIDVRVERVNLILGRALSAADIVALLDPLGYSPLIVDNATVRITVPSRRLDLIAEIDVIEEIGRRCDFSTIEPRTPRSPLAGSLTAVQQVRRRVKDVLAGLGCTEVYPTPFLSPDDVARGGWTGPVVELANPLVGEESVLRPSLLPGIVKAIALNASHRRTGVSLFEVGNLVRPGDGELPIEFEVVAVALAGQEAPAAVAVLDEVMAAFGIASPTLTADTLGGLHPTRTAMIKLGGIDGDAGPHGVVGEIDPDVLASFGVTERVAWLAIHLDALVAARRVELTYDPVRKVPSSDLDLAFVAAHEIPAGVIESALTSAAGARLVSLRLFDVYRGVGVPDGARSLAFRLRFQADDHTLTDVELTDLRERCVAAAAAVGGLLRT
jgi:phenylalanyl-tRNA synthetase beta chain